MKYVLHTSIEGDYMKRSVPDDDGTALSVQYETRPFIQYRHPRKSQSRKYCDIEIAGPFSDGVVVVRSPPIEWRVGDMRWVLASLGVYKCRAGHEWTSKQSVVDAGRTFCPRCFRPPTLT